MAREEYQARWTRVQAAMAGAGHENLLVWQRSASTYDRVGDVYWLTNFQTYGTGQDPPSDELGEPYTFSAVLIRKGREPELHVGLTKEDIDLPRLFCGKLVTHEPHMIVELAEYLRAGVSVHHFQTELRMQAAMKLLSTTRLPIGEIAERTGCSEPTNFTAAFKAFFAVPPRHVRGERGG